MSLIIFAIVVLVIASLLIWAVQMLPLQNPPSRIIQALIIVLAAVAIGHRAGLF